MIRYAGTVVVELNGDGSGKGVHRAAFLSELLKPVPKELMHTNKKVVKIEDTGVAVSIYFDDGTQSEFDALIGADGVRGYSRKYILGSGHPALNTKLAGFWDCRALVPIQKAKEVLADKYFEEGRQHAWIGDGGFFMHDVLNSGATVQCVGSILTEEEWGSDEWKRNLDQEKLAQAFSSWENAPIVDGMVKVCTARPQSQ